MNTNLFQNNTSFPGTGTKMFTNTSQTGLFSNPSAGSAFNSNSGQPNLMSGTGSTQPTGMFGNLTGTYNQPTGMLNTGNTQPMFGTGTSQPMFGTGTSQPMFGTGTSQPMFGSESLKSTAVFGTSSNQPSGLLTAGTYNQPTGMLNTGNTQPMFGTGTSQPMFGTGTSQPMFGTGTSQPMFGTGTSQPMFGTGTSQPMFGTGTSQPMFGTGQTSSKLNVYGNTKTNPSGFYGTSNITQPLGTSGQPIPNTTMYGVYGGGMQTSTYNQPTMSNLGQGNLTGFQGQYNQIPVNSIYNLSMHGKNKYSIPNKINFPVLPTGILNSDNNMRNYRIGSLQNENMKSAFLSVYNRVEQVNHSLKKLKQARNSLFHSIQLFRTQSLDRIVKCKENLITISQQQKKIRCIEQQVNELENITNQHFQQFANALKCNRNPKTVIPSQFTILFTEKLSHKVNDLDERVTEIQNTLMQNGTASDIDVLQALWDYLKAVAFMVFNFKEIYTQYRNGILQKRRITGDIGNQIEQEKAIQMSKKYFIFDALNKMQQTLMQRNQQTLTQKN